MRIAYLSGDLGVPVFGTKGASIHVRELTRALRALGHEVLILSPRAEGDRPPGFDVPVRAVPAESREQRHRYASVLRRRALPLLRGFEPDAIYERHSLFGTAGARLSDDLGVPHLLEVNAPLADEHARFRDPVGAVAARRVERAVVRSATRVVAVSRGIERWLLAAGVDPGRVAVLPNGVDPDRFRPRDGEGAAVRSALGLDGRPVVGFVGTLKPWHDVATLVRALAIVGGARLLVVGDGPERARLAAEAEAAAVPATFAGAVPHDRVAAHLAAVDVAAAPYAADDRFYFSPLKLVEYLAAARPVAAADIGEIRHCVGPRCLYEPGDAAGLADVIGALIEDRAGAAELAAAGREHVRAEHSWTATAAAVVRLVEAAA